MNLRSIVIVRATLLVILAVAVFAPAAEAQPYSLGNRVWFDADNNGTINGSENGIDGVTVDLYAAGNLTSTLASAVTSGGGLYQFNGLPAGDYVVSIGTANFSGTLSGYWSSGTSRTTDGTIVESAASDPGDGVDSDDNGTRQTSGTLSGSVISPPITLGATNLSVDFGFYSMRLGSLVWNDGNNDGDVNNAEPGLDSVTVELRSADGSALLDSTTTASGGLYEFRGQPAGDSIVRLPASNFNPAGVLRDYRSSTGLFPTLGYEPAPDPDTDLTDSDDNGTEANGLLGFGGFIQSAPVTLTPGAEQSTNAFGITTEGRVDFGVNSTPQIDLTATKTDGQPSYVPVETLHYTIIVTNNGPADANGMTVHDDRPSQVGSWTWTCAPGTPVSYNCSDDASNPASFSDTIDLPQLASITYNVTAQVDPVVNSSLTNMVYVVPPPGMTDLTPADNFGTDVDALNAVDLSVTKSDGQATYAPGGVVSYTIAVTNHGPADANGMSVSDARPAQIASWTWTCDAGTPPAYQCSDNATNPTTFTDSLDLPAAASVTYHVTAQIADSVSGDLTNSVQVTPPAGTAEQEPADNSASDVDTLGETTLAITKSASPNPVPGGGILTYTIQVSNSGAVNAMNVTVTDPLPATVTFLDASGGGWNCSETSGTVTCTRTLLAPGDAPPIAIRVRVPIERGVLTNSATVSSGNATAASASTPAVIASVIPTLDGWGLAAFGALLAGLAVLMLSRR